VGPCYNLSMQKTAFTIFHVPHSQRNHLYKSIKKSVSEGIGELDTKTIFFKDSIDLRSFYDQEQIVFSMGGPHGDGWLMGELGLWAGTYIALKNFLNSDYENLIFFEDDLILESDFVNNLEMCMLELPKDWDIFFVYSPIHERKQQVALEEKSPEFFESAFLPEKKRISKAFQHYSTACYMVNRASAKKIVDLANKGISLPIDCFLIQQSGLSSYSLRCDVPYICSVDQSLPSQIQNKQKQIFDFFAN